MNRLSMAPGHVLEREREAHVKPGTAASAIDTSGQLKPEYHASLTNDERELWGLPCDTV